MERIKKALDKAQKQRQDVDAQQQPTDIQKIDKKVGTQDIAYSNSRNIEVSAKLLKKHRIVAGFDDDPRADLYKILRTKVLQKMQANNWNLLAVTSPTKGAGKTHTAINLAISIAMDAKFSVLLADLDLRNPSVHKYLGMPGQHGLSDYFSGEKSIAELLIHPGLEKMVVLPAGRSIQRSSDLLSTPKMMELANELKHRYTDRIVVVDLPPLLQTDDAMMFMPNVDACLLVVAEGENNDEEVHSSIELIEQDKYLGSVLNKSAEVGLVSYTY